MLRVLLALLTIAPFCCSQTLPAFRWALEVDGPGVDQFAGLGTDAQGNIYVAGSTRSPNFPVQSAVQSHSGSPGLNDVFVTKLDPSGNIVYSTYFGGSGDDIATAMTVDPAGNVYVTGTTTSTNFPTTPGTYSPSVPPPSFPGPVFGFNGSSFLFRLNPDGAVGYSTYFSTGQTVPHAIAVDSLGSAYITGTTGGGIVTTPGAYQTVCNCQPLSTGFLILGQTDAFLTRFDAAGSQLIYSTYLGVSGGSGIAVAVAADGSAYTAGPSGVYRLDAAGASLLASAGPIESVQAIALAPDGSVYLAGSPLTGTYGIFQPTAGAFQANPRLLPSLPSGGGGSGPAAIVKTDAQLRNVLAATYFGGAYGNDIRSIALDPAGNVYAGGSTSPRDLPARTPLVQGFGSFVQGFGLISTGYLAELTGDLSTLLFSSDFGDNEVFAVMGIGMSSNGSVVLGGATGNGTQSQPVSIWVNSLALAPPPSLRVDAVVNAASGLTDPVSPGETIRVRGAGFGSDAQLTIGGVPVPAISISPTEIVAVAPANLADTATTVQVQSGGVSSNQLLVSVAAASPGLFSADSSGTGQGYILNQDGTLNTPSNPAVPGDKITIFATGVGPLSFTGGYAVTQYPVSVFVNGFYCNGVAAAMGPVAGFPGDVYQLTVMIPSPAELTANNPDLKNFRFAALVGLTLRINGAPSQNGVAISIAQ